MPTPKQAHALVTYFTQQYKKMYGFAPTLNRYASRWGFDSMLMDMSESEVKELIDYYFTTPSTNSHTLEWFFYNYEKLVESKRVADEDQTRLAVIRERTRLRTEEWRKKQRDTT